MKGDCFSDVRLTTTPLPSGAVPWGAPWPGDWNPGQVGSTDTTDLWDVSHVRGP